MDSDNDNKNIFFVFAFLGVILALIVVLISFFTISYTVIDTLLTDPTDYWHSYFNGRYQGLPFALSFFFVSFPLFLYFSRKVSTVNAGTLSRGMTRLRSSAVAFALTVATGILVISSAILIYNFLTGDLTIRFFLKLLVAVGAGGALFYYYRGIWKNKWEAHRSAEKYIGWFALVAFVAITVVSTVLVDPMQARIRENTQDTLNAAQSLLFSVDDKYRKNKELPQTLQERNENTTYTRDSNSTFTICLTVSAVMEGMEYKDYPYTDFPYTEPGTHCFPFSMSPEGEYTSLKSLKL